MLYPLLYLIIFIGILLIDQEITRVVKYDAEINYMGTWGQTTWGRGYQLRVIEM